MDASGHVFLVGEVREAQAIEQVALRDAELGSDYFKNQGWRAAPRTQRKPMNLSLPPGQNPFRSAERRNQALLTKEPPRSSLGVLLPIFCSSGPTGFRSTLCGGNSG